MSKGWPDTACELILAGRFLVVQVYECTVRRAIAWQQQNNAINKPLVSGSVGPRLKPRLRLRVSCVVGWHGATHQKSR